MRRSEGALIREFNLPGHDRSHPAELRNHAKEKTLVLWYVDTNLDGKLEARWKIFLAGPECERYRK